MPELPEVETIRRGLEKYTVGHKIEKIDIIHPGIFEGEPDLVEGAEITGVRRLAKGLIIDLDNSYSLAMHIKLTGQLIYRDKATEKIAVSKEKVGSIPNQFTHIIFELDQNAKLYYNDQRRFGWIRVVPTSQVLEMKFFKTLGPEPLSAFGVKPEDPDRDLTIEKFRKIASSSSTKIKPLLMDQEKIGGIGNIYANDALFRSGIDPRRAAKSLTRVEIDSLYDSIIKVMEKSFEEGGASELSFVNVLGQEGGYQRHALVYGKRKEPCVKCGGNIEFFKLAGRGTYFCANCQK